MELPLHGMDVTFSRGDGRFEIIDSDSVYSAVNLRTMFSNTTYGAKVLVGLMCFRIFSYVKVSNATLFY